MEVSKWNEIYMSNNTSSITREEIMAVYPKVAENVADALACDKEKVKPDSSLINDLGAESIDFLDIVFRLERAFKVKIPRGKLIEDARGDLSESEFEKGGVVSDAGFKRLQSFLSEVPAERLKAPLKVADIPRLFTTETFCKIVIRQQKAAAAAAPAGPQHA
jgi:acyl carrier protein